MDFRYGNKANGSNPLPPAPLTQPVQTKVSTL